MSDNITGTKKSLSIPGDGTLLVKELCLIISTKRKKMETTHRDFDLCTLQHNFMHDYSEVSLVV